MEIKRSKTSETSLFDLVSLFNEYKNYLLKNIKLIIVLSFSGAVIGLACSFLIKPKYTAKITFSLIDGTMGKGGLMDLASNFGLSSLMGGNDVFSGDNLLEIIQSKYAIDKTLLTPVDYQGKKVNLIDIYIDYNHLKEKWARSKKQGVRNLNFPVGQARETFTREQDSILSVLYKKFILKNELVVVRKSKKIAMSEVSFTSKNELFSKLFVENLMNQTYIFYKQTKTAQTNHNLEKMVQTADSIRRLYENALTKSSTMSRVNINQALQIAVVPKIKQENDAQLYASVYAEVLKNLETVKLDLARETPIVQIVDTPRFPLEVKRIGKIKGTFFGGVYALILTVLFLILKKYFLRIKVEYKLKKANISVQE